MLISCIEFNMKVGMIGYLLHGSHQFSDNMMWMNKYSEPGKIKSRT